MDKIKQEFKKITDNVESKAKLQEEATEALNEAASEIDSFKDGELHAMKVSSNNIGTVVDEYNSFLGMLRGGSRVQDGASPSLKLELATTMSKEVIEDLYSAALNIEHLNDGIMFITKDEMEEFVKIDKTVANPSVVADDHPEPTGGKVVQMTPKKE